MNLSELCQDVVQNASGGLSGSCSCPLNYHRRRVVVGGYEGGIVRSLQAVESIVRTYGFDAYLGPAVCINGSYILEFLVLGLGLVIESLYLLLRWDRSEPYI